MCVGFIDAICQIFKFSLVTSPKEDEHCFFYSNPEEQGNWWSWKIKFVLIRTCTQCQEVAGEAVGLSQATACHRLESRAIELDPVTEKKEQE